MTFFSICLLFLVVSVLSVSSYPVSQPIYPNNQYVSAQSIPYRQPTAPGYVPQAQTQYTRQQQAAPVYEPRTREGLQNYASYTAPQQFQPFQAQKTAQIGNPVYIQPSLLASQAQEAFSTAQRKASSQAYNGNPAIQQQLPVATQVQPQQYVKEKPLRYISRPVTAQYRVKQGEQEPIEKENQEDYDPNPSYQFGFDVNDDLYTNYQNRKEQRDGNKITGSYSVVDSDGFLRTVQYTADPKEGFKAEVTRQPTDIVVKIPKPDPQFQAAQRSQQPQQRYVQAVPMQRDQYDKKPQLYQYQ